ncbi:uncharacterized protein N7459_006863 [Penicillium hispanicum]|uniref:uncharacterized protein n=1 Tax=Penicillium hispanicum TaxID=1080232 RepID=UPI002541E90E|nr:uncharacterized protein N7459_006863 [Penicillium hispanicum]KAJ5577899.1 hypothetical protein N7459_006863 [Penicillium hispanicum]
MQYHSAFSGFNTTTESKLVLYNMESESPSVLALRTRYAAITARQKQQEENLIQELKKEIDGYKRQVRQLAQEVDAEKASRIACQEKLRQLTHNNFVMVLVDGDGAVFLDEYLKKPREGAIKASHELTLAVKENLKNTPLDRDDLTILVRIFANVTYLGKTLHLTNVIASRTDFIAFTEQFTTSSGEFDFINVGPGKENADYKMRKMLNHYYSNAQCRRIFFVGCHDNGYHHDLQEYTSDPESKERIVLVETTPAQPIFKTLLPFTMTRFDNVFRSTPLPSEQQPSPLIGGYIPELGRASLHEKTNPRSSAWTPGQDSRTNSPPSPKTQLSSTHQAAPISGSNPQRNYSSHAGLLAITRPVYPNDPGPVTPNLTPEHPSEHPRYIYCNRNGERLDPAHTRPVDPASFDSYSRKLAQVNTLNGKGFCNYLYLLGFCKRGDACPREHNMKLTRGELSIHRWKARHHCPWDPDCSHAECRFTVHLSADDLVPWVRWTEGKGQPELLRRAVCDEQNVPAAPINWNSLVSSFVEALVGPSCKWAIGSESLLLYNIGRARYIENAYREPINNDYLSSEPLLYMLVQRHSKQSSNEKKTGQRKPTKTGAK